MRKTMLVAVALVLIVVGASIVYGFLLVRGGFSTRAMPSKLETFLATRMRRLAIPQNARDVRNPVVLKEEVLRSAMQHWADHCATCHGVDGRGNTVIGQNVYPQAPDMRQERTQKLSDGELFYIIQNGIRLSAMPAWGGEPEHETGSWELVHLIRHFPELTAEEEKWMQQFVPRSPAEHEHENTGEDVSKEEHVHPEGHHHH